MTGRRSFTGVGLLAILVTTIAHSAPPSTSSSVPSLGITPDDIRRVTAPNGPNVTNDRFLLGDPVNFEAIARNAQDLEIAFQFQSTGQIAMLQLVSGDLNEGLFTPEESIALSCAKFPRINAADICAGRFNIQSSSPSKNGKDWRTISIRRRSCEHIPTNAAIASSQPALAIDFRRLADYFATVGAKADAQQIMLGEPPTLKIDGQKHQMEISYEAGTAGEQAFGEFIGGKHSPNLLAPDESILLIRIAGYGTEDGPDKPAEFCVGRFSIAVSLQRHHRHVWKKLILRPRGNDCHH